MSNNNVINEKKKALLAYKEKILEEIKYYETSINDFRANHKNNSFHEDHADSSDSEDDFPQAIDNSPSIPQLKLQQAMMKTCLQATQELTSLMVLQSEVNVLVEDPKFEGERPVTEPGTWREVTAECRIDLIPFTITFFMHTPNRKFAPPSYRALQVVPVKNVHEIELSKSVLHSVKLPSDAIEVEPGSVVCDACLRLAVHTITETPGTSRPGRQVGHQHVCVCCGQSVLRQRSHVVRNSSDRERHIMNVVAHRIQPRQVLKSYAAGYRSRRTTLARLANKYGSALFMEPYTEGGFVLKCADLLEVSWKLENKWSPVARFHHKMKFDLDYMDEAYIKIIAQAHKQLLDPAIQTDERTLLLAKIISTCLEVRGPIDPESDLESKTTERDNDIEKRDSENEKRDSEVMAPPKSLPKKVKQKSALPNPAQKRGMDDENGDGAAKKMKNDEHSEGSKKTTADNGNVARKTKINDVVTEGGKKRKTNEVTDKVASNKIVKKSGNIEDKDSNTKSKQAKDSVNTGQDKATVKKITATEAGNSEDKAGSTKPKTKESGKTDNKGGNTKPKNVKGTANIEDKTSNTKTKTKIVKDTGKTEDTDGNTKLKEINLKDVENTEQNKGSVKSKTKIVKESNKIDTAKNVNTKTVTTKDAGKPEQNINEEDNNAKTKMIKKKKSKIVTNVKSKENIEAKSKENIEAKSKEDNKEVDVKNITEKVTTKNVERPKSKKISNVANTKNTETNPIKTVNKPKTTDPTKSKEKNVANAKNDDELVKKASDYTKNKDKLAEVTNKGSKITVKDKQTVNLNVKNDHIVKKVTEKNATNNKNKDQITNKVSEKNLKDKDTENKETVPQKVISINLVTKKTKEIKKLTKEPIKTIKNITHKISSHRNSLKVQNPQKTLKTGNTKIFSAGNTEKENGGKSKIPQKKLSEINESFSKKNLLRISPRKMSSKFKSSSQENTFKQKLMKTTNIPRLLKKPAPKTT